ncbi:hypothetical protein MRX96_040295 [Rhipicephalus microplus]
MLCPTVLEGLLEKGDFNHVEDLVVVTTTGEEDIIREASHTDVTTGRTITVPLSHVRLRPDAVPSKFPSCPTYLSSETLSKIQEVLPILVYVAGYAVYATLKRLNCAKCKDVLTVDKTITVSAAHEHYDLVKQLDRGGLVYPSMFALNAVAHCYVVVEQLATQPELLLMRKQRQVVKELTLHLLANEEPSDFNTCAEIKEKMLNEQRLLREQFEAAHKEEMEIRTKALKLQEKLVDVVPVTASNS